MKHYNATQHDTRENTRRIEKSRTTQLLALSSSGKEKEKVDDDQKART